MEKLVLKIAVFTVILVLPIALFAQNGTLTGKVTDSETGAPLMGANIFIEGTTLGAAAGMDGVFAIAAVPPGNYNLKVSFIGYESLAKAVQITANAKVTVNFQLKAMVLSGRGITITANRAVDRETPIAFSNISGENVANKYTTQDLPELLRSVPGVFATSNGLGESELYVRGFDADRVQVLINGIPVNDPESQVVYWSNWTGLSSNVQSVQVQRGVGSSLYGSGAFGGSLNIETMGLQPKGGLSIRSSVGYFTTQGATVGANDGKIADGKGNFEEYTPINYNASIRYNSGLLYDGKLNYSLMFERKAGDSYVDGTIYDGYSFGLEAQSIFGPHKFLLSFITAPQKHNQARTIQDMELLTTLGREYNRNNHPYQENYYNKPLWSLRHEWNISSKQNLITNAFFTMGNGGGRYLRNDNFDVNTGLVDFKPVSESTDIRNFGRNARFIYENTGVILSGYDPANKTYLGTAVSRATNIITGAYDQSFKNDSENNHVQYGLNTYYQHSFSSLIQVVVGGEGRRWVADHFADSELFRSNDASKGSSNQPLTWDKVQRRYDYTTTVEHLSTFGRVLMKPLEDLNIMVDAQYAHYDFEIVENPLEIFDFTLGQFTGKKFLSTKDLKDADGNPKFKDSDYLRTFSFFTPKFGVNYNLTRNINLMVNYSIANKEPDAGDWYNRDFGPGANQPEGQSLKAEKVNNAEFGIGYRSSMLALNANLYRINFTDRIERVTDLQGTNFTLNAGKALHQGVELSANTLIGIFDAAASFTYSRNRWEKMNFKTIFGEKAEDVVDKVVPFSPEIMANGSVGVRFGKLRLGLGVNWWDEYYGSYTNQYTLANGSKVDAKLPYFLELNANVSFGLNLFGADVNLRLDVNNITNRENFANAAYSSDFNRNDALSGKYYMYVQQAPLLNTFLTTEIAF